MQLVFAIFAFLSFAAINCSPKDEYETTVEGLLEDVLDLPSETFMHFKRQISGKLSYHLFKGETVEQSLNIYRTKNDPCVANYAELNATFNAFRKDMEACEKVAVNASKEIIAGLRLNSQLLENNIRDFLRSRQESNEQILNTTVESYTQNMLEKLGKLKQNAEKHFDPILTEADSCGQNLAAALVFATIWKCIK